MITSLNLAIAAGLGVLIFGLGLHPTLPGQIAIGLIALVNLSDLMVRRGTGGAAPTARTGRDRVELASLGLALGVATVSALAPLPA